MRKPCDLSTLRFTLVKSYLSPIPSFTSLLYNSYTTPRDVFKLDISRVGVECFLSPVVKQMMSNTVVAMCDVVQMCFVGFSIQIEGAAMAESVALFTHYQAAQLSEFCQPGRGTHTRIKN